MSSCSLCECSSDCSCSRLAELGPRHLHNSNAILFSRHPLVYYAEVSDYSTKYKDHKNDKPNCFVRAFRWYTQDHSRFKTPSSKNKDVGFAAWLDQKYEQYLRDSTLNATTKSEVNSSVEPPATNQQQDTPKADKPKGFQRRIKSTWKKRRTCSKGHEGEYSRADHIDNCKCNPSFQTILRPKSMSHLPSETCALNIKTMYVTSSKVTVSSSDTRVTARTYSKPCSFIIQETPVEENGIHKLENKNPTVKAGPFNSQDTCALGENNCSKAKTSKNTVECECHVAAKESARTRTVDANTQYDPNTNVKEEMPIDKITTSGACRLTTKTSVSFDKSSQPICDNPKYCQKSVCGPCAYTNHIQGAAQTPQCWQKSVCGPCAYTNHIHGAAQTSDHAINLENCTCECPLLVRIVKAKQTCHQGRF